MLKKSTCMKTIISFKKGMFWIVVIALMLFPGIAQSNSSSHFFVGYGLAQVQIGGDMDGYTFIGGGGSVEVLPKQPTAIGNKFIAGFQYDSGGVLELSITQSDHDGTWAGIELQSEFFSLDIDGKLLLRSGKIVRPFGLLGIGFTNVTVKNGSTDGYRVSDAQFNGMDLRFGLGVEFALYKGFALDLQAVKRMGSYNTVDGIVSGDIEEDVNGDGVTTSVELKYIFGK